MFVPLSPRIPTGIVVITNGADITDFTTVITGGMPHTGATLSLVRIGRGAMEGGTGMAEVIFVVGHTGRLFE